MGAKVTPRQQTQLKLEEYLGSSKFWTAPYGVLTGITDLPRGGKVREVTFGVARTLDCNVRIWSPSKLTVQADGPLHIWLEQEYNSVEGLIQDLKIMAGEA